MANNRYFSVSYKQVEDIVIYLDVYPPLSHNGSTLTPDARVPAVVYFHGGGLTVGDRQSWFPAWMQRRTNAAGYAFISADYRLIPPLTGHDILADIKDVFTFLAHGALDSHLDKLYSTGAKLNDGSNVPEFRVDPNALAVAGSSAGGLCAYLAAMHASPKPKAVVSCYGMGADFLTPHYLSPKVQPFYKGQELLNPDSLMDYLYPFGSLQTISGCPLIYNHDTSIPNLSLNPRLLLPLLFLQLGNYLDYYTGEHEPSLSSTLRKFLDAKSSSAPGIRETEDEDPKYSTPEGLRRLVPERHHLLLPQFGVTSDWPPTFLCHGVQDTVVPIHDSRHLYSLLEQAGVPVQLEAIEGMEHGFDPDLDIEASFSGLFDSVGEFLKRWLQPTIEEVVV